MSKTSHNVLSVDKCRVTFDRFRRFVTALDHLYGVSLAVPDFSDLAELSQFCTGLVEGAPHPWRRDVSRLGRVSRFGLAHSVFLFRKVIPKAEPRVEPYMTKLSEPSPAPDEDFLRFSLKEVRRLFPRGWDGSYVGYCWTSSYPVTSCYEMSRAMGGARGVDGFTDAERADFVGYLLRSPSARPRGASRVKAIETGGKWRVISIPPRIDNALRPLHKSLYSRLSQFKWLLRGDAKPESFSNFTPVQGEVFVSGDYENATDNLNSHVQVAILQEILSRSCSVPPGIAEHAVSIYSSVLENKDGSLVTTQARGQLMGQLTSFPMLCLINYLTFRYFIRREVPLRINGDDIAFRATPDEFDRWERGVVKGGLTLSKGKTLVHSRGFTLNSTAFWSTPSGAKGVGFVRPVSIWSGKEEVESTLTLRDRFFSASKFFGRERATVVRSLFVQENLRAITRSRRSVTRGLGMPVSEGLLRQHGLWYRELFYLEQPEERRLPLPFAGGLPDGWVPVPVWRVGGPSQVKAWESLFGSACGDWAWSEEGCSKEGYVGLRELWEGCLPYGFVASSKVRRMLGLSRSAAWRWCCRRRDVGVFGRSRFLRKGEVVFVLADRSYHGEIGRLEFNGPSGVWPRPGWGVVGPECGQGPCRPCLAEESFLSRWVERLRTTASHCSAVIKRKSQNPWLWAW